MKTAKPIDENELMELMQVSNLRLPLPLLQIQ